MPDDEVPTSPDAAPIEPNTASETVPPVERPTPPSPHRRAIGIAASVVVAAVVIVGALSYVNGQADKRDRCPQLQAEARDAMQSAYVDFEAATNRIFDLQGEWEDLGCEGGLLHF